MGVGIQGVSISEVGVWGVGIQVGRYPEVG